ncbi:hypothetical protein AMECASPLE_022264 [Ameca splendens]|uniref:Uncharacterized protein n=1 Tax=Ameca splendens TaxID=208324 RepID=A0ABV0ZPG8_9TELE
MWENGQHVKLRFELDDTLQTIDATRGKLLENSNLPRSTLLYDPSPLPRQQESRPWDSGGSYHSQPLPGTQVREAQGPPVYHEKPPVPSPRMDWDVHTPWR